MSGDEAQPPGMAASRGQRHAETAEPTGQGPQERAGPTEWRAGGRRARLWVTICLLVSALLLFVPVLEVARNGWSLWVLARLLGTLSPLMLVLVVVLPRTRGTEDGLELRRGLTRPLVVPWSEVADLRAEGGRWATVVTVHLDDGRRYPLPGVQTEQLGEVQAARASVTGQER